MKRRLSAILAADMVGFSRLMEADEIATLTRQKAHRRDLIDPALADFNGTIIKEMGDGLLVEFASVADAVQCAVRIQRAVASHEADRLEDDRIQYRMGINLGDVLIDGTEMFGDGINIAARLEPLAEPGGICLSGTAYDTLRSPLDVGFVSMGEVSVKNISRPIRAYRIVLDPGAAPAPRMDRRWVRGLGLAMLAVALVAGALVVYGFRSQNIVRAPDAPNDPALALFPFRVSQDVTESAYLASGIAEDIAAAISQQTKVLLITPSADTANTTLADITQAAQRYGADYSLSGSLRRDGIDMRVTIHLGNIADGTTLLAKAYDSAPDAMVRVSSDISTDIIAVLPAAVRLSDQPRRAAYHFPDARAYDLLLQGNELLARFNRSSLQAAADLFSAAMEADPDYARARANMAFVLALEIAFGWSTDPAADAAKAEALITRALDLDPASYQAILARGLIARSSRNYDAASAHFKTAILIAPNSADAYAMAALTHVFAGHPDQGLAAIEQAMQRNPDHPFFYRYTKGMALFHQDRFEEAADQFTAALHRNPDFIAARLALVSALAHLGRIEDADWEMQEVLSRLPEFSLLNEQVRAPYADPNDLQRYMQGLQKVADAG